MLAAKTVSGSAPIATGVPFNIKVPSTGNEVICTAASGLEFGSE